MTALEQTKQSLHRLRMVLYGVAALGAIGLLSGWAANTGQFYKSYLWSFIFWLGFPAGCLIFTMVHNLSGGKWGVAVRQPLRAGLATWPLMVLLFLPVAFGMPYIYKWVRPGYELGQKWTDLSIYLNVPFFWARAAFYLLTWSALALLLNRWQPRGELPSKSQEYPMRLRRLSAAGLCFYGLTASFASADWTMSIEPTWHSKAYGMIFLSSQAITGIAFAVCTMGLLLRPIAAEKTKKKSRWDLGSLMAMTILLWTYLSFFQLLIIWSGNTVHRIPWYLHRTRGDWQWISWGLIVFHFAIPFFLLLFRKLKGNLAILTGLATYILIVHVVNIFWFVVPSFKGTALDVHWLDVLAPVSLGGIWLAFFVTKLEGGLAVEKV